MKLVNPIEHLRRIGGPQEAIARGCALGILLGFSPLFGLKTLLALGLAYLFRMSKAAAIIGVTLHDLALPFIPLLLRLEYDTGYWCLSHPHRFPPAISIHRLQMYEWLSWTTLLTSGGPLLLGSLVIGLPVAALSYLGLKLVLPKSD